jgi:hypothetical protein
MVTRGGRIERKMRFGTVTSMEKDQERPKRDVGPLRTVRRGIFFFFNLLCPKVSMVADTECPPLHRWYLGEMQRDAAQRGLPAPDPAMVEE